MLAPRIAVLSITVSLMLPLNGLLCNSSLNVITQVQTKQREDLIRYEDIVSSRTCHLYDVRSKANGNSSSGQDLTMKRPKAYIHSNFESDLGMGERVNRGYSECDHQGFFGKHKDLSFQKRSVSLFCSSRAITPVEIAPLKEGDGSIDLSSPPTGCTNPLACNYDAAALVDDGSCSYFTALPLLDTMFNFPNSVILPIPIGYDQWNWADIPSSSERTISEVGDYTLNLINFPEYLQEKEFVMSNVAPQTPYQGSWANAAVTNNELLRSSPSGEWSITAWVNLDHGDLRHSIIGKDLWWGNGYYVWIQDSLLFSAFNSIESGHVVRSSGVVLNGIYQHVAVTHDGTTRRHYVNGIEVGNWHEPSTFDFSGAAVGIGYCASDFECTFNGSLDELMVWHRSLSADDLPDLMHCPYEIDQTGLAAFWDFEDADGGASADKSGNGIGLTFVNSPTVEEDARTNQCTATCESLTYRVSALMPHCHDPNACNYAGLLGYSAPDSCSYLNFDSFSVQPAHGANGLGAVFLVVAGGTPPYEVTDLVSNRSFMTQTWTQFLPNRLSLKASDSSGCETNGELLLTIPQVRCE
jgi:hypothetical protein